MITTEIFNGMDLFSTENIQPVETYSVRSGLYQFSVLILNEFDSVTLEPYAICKN